jgi:putative transposase
MHTPGRGDGALRRYRVSLPATAYFLTLCTEARSAGLTNDDTALANRAEITAIETDGHWTHRACVVMPDHLHLLVRLTGDLPLARCVARLKSKTRPALLAHDISWQPNFYEHRLRPADAVEDVVRYVFINPYRANLVPIPAPYRWFWLGAEEERWFKPGTDQGRPFPEWLR